MSDKNNCFKEAVCIEVQRIFDSCSDRDCIYELPVTLTEDSPEITDEMNIVRARCAEVEATCILVEPVPFKSGYYSVDITYRFKITAEAFSKTFCQPTSGTVLCGTALWNKRVILYGGEGNSKVFSSDQDFTDPAPIPPCDGGFCSSGNNSLGMPTARVHVVDPVSLEAKFICVPCKNKCAPCPPSSFPPPPPPPPPPSCDCDRKFDRILTVSLGLFSIVQLTRPASILVPAYDYCIPCKDCSNGVSASEAPCDVFDRIEFPTELFYPQPAGDSSKCCGFGGINVPDNSGDSSCGCNSDG